jgi:hypothetical protein
MQPEEGQMTSATEPKPSWFDMTLRVAEDADVEIEMQPNGDIEYTIPVPELPSSRITFVVPAVTAKKINGKVREFLMLVPATALALIS